MLVKVQGEAGKTVTLRHAETLRDGLLYMDNLRGAQCVDRYTLNGGDTECYEPRFTYHGFRYVELRGAIPARRILFCASKGWWCTTRWSHPALLRAPMRP